MTSNIQNFVNNIDNQRAVVIDALEPGGAIYIALAVLRELHPVHNWREQPSEARNGHINGFEHAIEFLENLPQIVKAPAKEVAPPPQMSEEQMAKAVTTPFKQ